MRPWTEIQCKHGTTTEAWWMDKIENYKCEECMIDQTGIPSAECINCGGTWFRIYATFDPDDYEISAYLIDNAQCATCDAEITVPTPIDLPETAPKGSSDMYKRFLQIYNLTDSEYEDD